MRVGDLVRVKPKYSEWGYGVGIFLGSSSITECRVLFEDRVLIFMRYELEIISESR